MSEGLQALGAAVAVEWPRPLPVLLAPAPDEALSSWMARHAAFFGVGRTGLLRHCLPDVPSLHLLNRALRPEQEARLAHLFRLGRPALRRMTHAELNPDAIGQLVAHEVGHWCEPCARSLAEAGFSKAVLRIWFHTWRITCPQCVSVPPAFSADRAVEYSPVWRGGGSPVSPALWGAARL